jgi:hypothetical protein
MMAKVKMPLMSMDASGAIGDAVVASKWKGRNYFRIHVRPAQPRTDSQVGVRASFAGLVDLIKGESDAVKAEWADFAKTMQITWLNAFVQTNQKNISDGLGIQQRPTATPEGMYPYAPDLSIEVVGRRVRFTITTASGDGLAYGAFLHISKTANFTPSWSNLKSLVKAERNGGSVVVELTMKPGTYYAKCRMSSPNRVFSPASSEVSFTVS